MSEVCVTELEPQVVIGMWKRGTYAEVGVMIGELLQFARTSGAVISGPPIFVCHETPRQAVKANEEATADVEVVVPISNVVDGQGSVTCYEIPGGPMAKIVHKGPYESSAPTYKKLFEWIAANHKKVAGPTREVYLNDPREVSPEEILTEIYAPIA